MRARTKWCVALCASAFVALLVMIVTNGHGGLRRSAADASAQPAGWTTVGGVSVPVARLEDVAPGLPASCGGKLNRDLDGFAVRTRKRGKACVALVSPPPPPGFMGPRPQDAQRGRVLRGVQAARAGVRATRQQQNKLSRELRATRALAALR